MERRGGAGGHLPPEGAGAAAAVRNQLLCSVKVEGKRAKARENEKSPLVAVPRRSGSVNKKWHIKAE